MVVSSASRELGPSEQLYPDRIFLSQILLKLRANYLDFLHESSKFSSRVNAAHGLVITFRDGKSTRWIRT